MDIFRSRLRNRNTKHLDRLQSSGQDVGGDCNLTVSNSAYIATTDNTKLPIAIIAPRTAHILTTQKKHHDLQTKRCQKDTGVWNSVIIRRRLRTIPLSFPIPIPVLFLLDLLRRGRPGPVFPSPFGRRAPPPLRRPAPSSPLTVGVTIAITVSVTFAVTVTITVTIPVSVTISVLQVLVVAVFPISAAGRTA
jgi:hypothetical protein